MFGNGRSDQIEHFFRNDKFLKVRDVQKLDRELYFNLSYIFYSVEQKRICELSIQLQDINDWKPTFRKLFKIKFCKQNKRIKSKDFGQKHRNFWSEI